MPKQLSFPSTLSRERHKSILAFTCVEPKDKLAPQSSAFGVKPVLGQNDNGTVFLHMPDLGEKTYANSFSSDEMGMIEKILGAFMGDGDLTSKFSQSATILGSSIGGDARDKLSTDIANPHTTLRYKGPTLRQQTFEFELFPRNESELIAIRDIVHFFKLNSSTRVGGNAEAFNAAVPTSIAAAKTAVGNISNNSLLVGDRLKYPSQWIIQEISQSKKDRIMPLFRFGPAYCESVSITDAKDRPTFVTGDSISYTLKLQFHEAVMLTSADIEAGA